MTAHCHAAPALLTREYQGDHRRHVLTPAATRAAAPPLDNPFHISRLLTKGLPVGGGRQEGGGNI